MAAAASPGAPEPLLYCRKAMLPASLVRRPLLAAGFCVVLMGAVLAGRGRADLPRIAAGDFTYLGAFRLPSAQGDRNSFDYGGTALAFDPQDQALWLVGHDWYQRVAEVSIPVPAMAATIDSLPRATLRRPFADVLAGKLGSIGSGTAKIGGILPAGTDLIVSAYLYYDGSHVQVRSHFRVTSSGVTGPFQVGDAGAGFVSGYMTPIPMDWQAALGGTALTGQCCVPIVSRTSLGPAASVFNAADVGARDPIPATAVVGYPLEHPTIGGYDSNGQLFNGATSVAGVVFPSGTRSVLFIGRQSSNFCYGEGTGDSRLDRQPVPGENGVIYCYDPTSPYKGTHGYPYKPFVWAYDANDLVAVRNGTKQPWEITPYAAWTFDMPFESSARQIGGVAYDAASRRLYLSGTFEDGEAPLIHVFEITAAATETSSGSRRRNRPDDGEGYAVPRLAPQPQGR
jgi:hypothetical protein